MADRDRKGLVDVIIVGAQKAGTSTLLAYFREHPELEAQHTPEMTWYTDPPGPLPDLERLRARYFPRPRPGAIRLGKLAGLMYSDVGVARLGEHDPHAEVLVLMREPVARAYSAFWHARARGREPVEDFQAALDADPSRFRDDNSRRLCAYLDWGDYAAALDRVQAQFPREQVHALFLEDFLAAPRHALAPVAERLGIDVAALPDHPPLANPARVPRFGRGPALSRHRLAQQVATMLPMRLRRQLRPGVRRLTEVAKVPPPLDPSVANRLHEHFREPNRRLATMLGRELPAGW